MKTNRLWLTWLALVLSPILAWADIDVRDFGAVGNGIADDTAEITNAVAALLPNETLRFTSLGNSNIFLINSAVGITLKSNMKVDLGGCTVTAPNVNGSACALFTLPPGTTNVSISSGVLKGSLTGTPASGCGIVARGSTNIFLRNLEVRECFTDGLLLTNGFSQIKVQGCTFDAQRRTGMMISGGGKNVVVVDSSFQNTAGLSPQSGAYALVGTSGQTLDGLSFHNCEFLDNAGTGLFASKGSGTQLKNVSISGCYFDSNDQGVDIQTGTMVNIFGNRIYNHDGASKSGIYVFFSFDVMINGNFLENNYRGIYTWRTTTAQVQGNVVCGTEPLSGSGAGNNRDGISIVGLGVTYAEDCSVMDNIVTRCAGNGVVAKDLSRAQIVGNKTSQNGQRGILSTNVVDSIVAANTFSGNGIEAATVYDDLKAMASLNSMIAGNLFRVATNVRKSISLSTTCQTNLVVINDSAATNRIENLGVATSLSLDGSANNWNR